MMTGLGTRTALIAGLLCLTAASADAQRETKSGVSAFAIEAAGGTIGSLAGVALGLAVAKVDSCDSEDLSCILSGISVGGLGGVIGATLGTVVVGRSAGTRPSAVGAFVGSLIGVAAGVGVVHLITEEASTRLGRVGSVLVFSTSQGLVTALGSRIGASLRD